MHEQPPKIIDLSERIKEKRQREQAQNRLPLDSESVYVIPEAKIELSAREAFVLAESIIQTYSPMDKLFLAEKKWMTGTSHVDVVDRKDDGVDYASIPNEPILKSLERQRAFFRNTSETTDNLIRILESHSKEPYYFSRAYLYAAAELLVERFKGSR